MKDSRITKGEDQGHHQGARRVPGAAQEGGAPGTLLAALGGPPMPPFAYILPSGVETPNQEVDSAEIPLFRRHRRFQIGSAWRSCPGTLPERDHPSGRPSIAMDASRMCRE